MIMNPSTLYQRLPFSAIDRTFAETLQRLHPQTDAWTLLAAALVSHYASQGHVCINLADVVSQGIQADESRESILPGISLKDWLRRLSASPLVGEPGAFTPLIVKRHRLYMHRFWKLESDVADRLLKRCGTSNVPVIQASTEDDLSRIFPGANPEQIRAMLSAATHALTIISGGPGSGKTYTIAMLMVILNRLARLRNLTIRLAAPTGKAAVRLQNAIQAAMEQLLEDTGNKRIDIEPVQTIHRLLGVTPGSAARRYTAQKPLPADVVVVDEASMVDLSMMASLLEAVPTDSRLILLGDKDQLASVAPGAVLGDICSGMDAASGQNERHPGSMNRSNPLSRRIVGLTERYRFGSDSGIGLLGDAIKQGHKQQAFDVLKNPDMPEITLRSITDPAEWNNALLAVVSQSYLPVVTCSDPEQALVLLDRLKLLTPLRRGPYGVDALNSAVHRALISVNGISGTHAAHSDWYAGRPVMITRNDYSHQLFNGDIGIAMRERAGRHRRLRVYFPGVDGTIRGFPPEQLMHHESAFAMTVHKSQGSEFDRVVLVLPHQPSPILTRELIYTAVSRARHAVEIWGEANVFAAAIDSKTDRMSGLREALWQGENDGH
jgi:exodeoxyribonuclease V alpha subunit